MSMHLSSLYNRIFSGTETHLMVQRRQVASEPLPDGKTQEERESKINLINVLNQGN